MKELFHKMSAKVSNIAGSSFAFLAALLLVLVWVMTGPIFNFSNTWQLVINTGTTIVTFLMVFLLQNTQNRDAKAMQLKLDELIRASKTARDDFVGLEDLSDAELTALDNDFKALRERQVSSPVMVKLHKKIKEEHERRKSIGYAAHAASQAVSSFLNQNKQN